MRILKTSAFRRLLILALGCLAVGAATSANAGNIAWSAALNTPQMPNPKMPGFFIWHEGKGGIDVYMTAEFNGNLKKTQIMAGTITIASGTISLLGSSALGTDEFVTLVNPAKVTFSFQRDSGRHSLHFKLTGGTTLTFKATYDGALKGSIIYYGPKATNAKGSPDPVIFALGK